MQRGNGRNSEKQKEQEETEGTGEKYVVRFTP